MFNKDLITDSRLASAKKKDMTPLKISPEEQTAIFSGSDGTMYETSLDECSCTDFAIQGYAQPCKHMLRLAMELGKIPSDGMQSDVESARGKYHLGRAKEFIHNAPLQDVICFAKEYLNMLYSRECPKSDIFLKAMDLTAISDFPCITITKTGITKIAKGWDKDCEGLASVIRNRFGNEVIMRLSDSEFISVFVERKER